MDDEWLSVALGTGLLFIVGLVILYNALTHLSTFNEGTLFSVSLGSLLTLAPVFNIKSVQLGFNKITHTQTFNIQKVRAKNLVQSPRAGRDMHIYQFSKEDGGKSKKENIDSGYPISLEFTLDAQGDRKTVPLDIEVGTRIEGYVKSDRDVWVYILSPSSFDSFEAGGEFRAKWKAEHVSYALVSFRAPKAGRYYFVVTNDIWEDEEEETEDDQIDDAEVEVRLRTSN